jgi:MoaA/NifB/PqqE/SkfB family radical SAM enzyme
MKFNLKNYIRIGEAALRRSVPVYAHFGITHRCNLTCKMCGIWRYGNAKEELSVAEVDQVAQKMRRMGVAQVSLGGGEPFARDDIEEVIGCFLKENLNVRVLTNGIGIPPKRIDRLIDAGLYNFSISLDSLYPARFDYICEYEGAWDQAVQTMVQIGQKVHGKKGALPTINCVVSNLNLEELPDIVRFAREIGFAVSFLPIELLEDTSAGVQNWEARFIRYRPEMEVHSKDGGSQVEERVDRAYEQLIKMKKQGWPILNSTPYLRSSQEYLKTGHFPTEGCDAGRLYFSVSPNGQYTICHRTKHQYTNFLDPNFEEYFASGAYEKTRLLESGSCDGCMRACWIDTSAMFRTIEGFFETAQLSLKPKKYEKPTWERARKWARLEDIAIVPNLTNAK